MKVGIIGYGFVGKALANGINDSATILKIDPKLGTSTEDLVSFKPDIVFICVPTPLKEDLTLDPNNVNSVIEEILKFNINSLIVLKSTILPNYISVIDKRIKRFIYNPEFLRENSANEDFINSDLIVFGGEEEEIKEMKSFYENNTKCTSKDYIETDIITASLIKYTINSFLATKVIFFNEIRDIFNKSEATETWDNFIKALSHDKRIGDSHMQVPGPDGRFGYGGACFPKDTNAIYKYSKDIEAEFKLLKKVISLNNYIRAEYNEPFDRELEQNINFKENLEE
tara:strand:+ start:1574 stop:2425 length:852 start_codon:yes stop_codon:yes gene_type:complete